MAATGPAPKGIGNRRRYGQPQRGEWVDLQPLKKPILPPYRNTWQIPKYIWDAWRADPVTSQWSTSDIATARELATFYLNFKDSERRLIKTALGLTAAGRRDLRWRNAAETESAQKAAEKVAEIRRLRVVGAEHKEQT